MFKVPLCLIPLLAIAVPVIAMAAHTDGQPAVSGQGEKLTAPPPAEVRAVSTDAAPRLEGQSQAVIAGGFLFISGQLPRRPVTGEIVGGVTEAATERVIDNLEAILRAAGLNLADVVKTTVFLTSGREFAGMDAVYRRRFGNHRPARTIVVVDSVGCDCILEMEAVAKTRDAEEAAAR